MHPGLPSIFCTKQRNFKNALIVEYGCHSFKEQKPKQCIYCGDMKEQSSFYCNELKNAENLYLYLNKFPLLSSSRINNSSNIIWKIGTLDKNVSCFCL